MIKTLPAILNNCQNKYFVVFGANQFLLLYYNFESIFCDRIRI